MNEIIFNDKSSFEDMGLTISFGKEIGNPNKMKIIKRPPHSNIDVDFSEIYGNQTYENRTLRYPFNIIARNEQEMHLIKTKVVNWLANSNGKQPLYDSDFPGYYFLAEMVNSPTYSLNITNSLILNVEFEAYPFMISDLPEGHDIWDEINFELDVLQPTSFDVSGTQEIILINNGTPDVTPQIIADAPFIIISRGGEFELGSGVTKDHDFVLASGENHLTLRGNGHIEFVFYQELI